MSKDSKEVELHVSGYWIIILPEGTDVPDNGKKGSIFFHLFLIGGHDKFPILMNKFETYGNFW